jgi:hypothetical protein
MNHPEFTLTRYLYIKEDVFGSLIISIFEKNYDKSLFWASEIYYSDLRQELADYIHSIYHNFFYSNNPRLSKIMDVGVKRCDIGIHIIATMLLNLTALPRKFTLNDFMVRNPTPDVLPGAYEKETKLWIFANEIESRKYSTEYMENNYISSYKLLLSVCKYECDKKWPHVFGCGYKDMNQSEIFQQHIDHWLYYASYTPIWKDRIDEFNGIIDYDKHDVIFKADDDLEQFYELYGYDLDEQPFELYQKISHTSILSKNNINEFYKHYEANVKIHKIKLKRINKVSSQSK